MSVIHKEKVDFKPDLRQVGFQSMDGNKYIAEVVEPEEIENKQEKDALRDELEYAHRAKEQAIQLNYRLENRLREAQREIERLSEEINELNKLYRNSLDENRELEQMNEIMMNLVYIFAKRELGL